MAPAAEVCGDGIDNDCVVVTRRVRINTTTCGSSGRSPSQSDCTNYQGTQLAGQVTVDGLGYQTGLSRKPVFIPYQPMRSGGDTWFKVTYDGGGGAMVWRIYVDPWVTTTLLVGQGLWAGDEATAVAVVVAAPCRLVG